MKPIRDLFATVTEKLEKLARGNAVVARPISVGDRHLLPLCELAIGFGAGGGTGEGTGTETDATGTSSGVGGGAGGGAKASPVAILVIENGKARLERLGR
jgi:uncharacterized spore protein YtfJ